mgnify:CR=1 FL=1
MRRSFRQMAVVRRERVSPRIALDTITARVEESPGAPLFHIAGLNMMTLPTFMLGGRLVIPLDKAAATWRGSLCASNSSASTSSSSLVGPTVSRRPS